MLYCTSECSTRSTQCSARAKKIKKNRALSTFVERRTQLIIRSAGLCGADSLPPSLVRLGRDFRRRRGAWVRLQAATLASAARDAPYAPLPSAAARRSTSRWLVVPLPLIVVKEVVVVDATRCHRLVLQKGVVGRFVVCLTGCTRLGSVPALRPVDSGRVPSYRCDWLVLQEEGVGRFVVLFFTCAEKVVGLCPQSVFVTLCENLDCAPRPQGSGVGWSGATGGCGPGAQPRAMSCVVWLLPRYDALSSTAVAMATMDRSEMARRWRRNDGSGPRSR